MTNDPVSHDVDEWLIHCARQAGFGHAQWQAMFFDRQPYDVTYATVELKRFAQLILDWGAEYHRSTPETLGEHSRAATSQDGQPQSQQKLAERRTHEPLAERACVAGRTTCDGPDCTPSEVYMCIECEKIAHPERYKCVCNPDQKPSWDCPLHWRDVSDALAKRT